MYGGDNATAINSYDQKHTDFYIYPVSGSTFEYQIIPNGSGKTLIVTNPLNGNQIYYNNSNAFMSAREADAKKSLLVFANPVKDNLTVENIENDLSVQVFNMLGQKIYEGKSTDKKIKIDTQNFAIGQYILMIKGEKAYKFIKE
jgi:hypothetical protein